MVTLSMGKKIAYGIIALNKRNGRRSITLNEYDIFNKYLHRNLDFIDDWMHNEAREEINNYFDEILVNRMVVYRLKPQYTIRDLEHNFFTLWTELWVVINKEELTIKLNDLTYEDEQNLEEFKRIDERYQLEILKELCGYVKKRNELLVKFGKIREVATSLVNIDGITQLMELTGIDDVAKLESYSLDEKLKR